MIKKLKELWNKLDIWMMIKTANNVYLSDSWDLIKNPLVWIVLIIFLLFLLLFNL